MPKMSDIMLLYRKEEPVLSIRARTAVENLPVLIGESYGKIAAHLAELGEHPADIPFVAYYNLDMQNLDVEMGFPVHGPLPQKGEIKASFIPAGKSVCCMYRGPYAGMAPLYGEMTKWIGENGHEPVGTVYERYHNGPGFPESELLTQIVMPVK